jgi:double-stranded RNA-specific adenosine deaminase
MMSDKEVEHKSNSSDNPQPQPASSSEPPPTISKKTAVRHAEKRRTSTCLFADQVARVSIDHYRRMVPKEQRLPQTCLAAIVAHYKNDGHLQVLSMGAGTKFLSESCLRQEEEGELSSYGRRVRDCHAEVLARRAFRRQLTLEILHDLQEYSSSKNCNDDHQKKKTQRRLLLSRVSNTITTHYDATTTNVRYRLQPGITLHMYTSSTPCGNATLKKFSKMTKVKFREDLGPNEWPTSKHEAIPGHSIKLGQFALLLKKDSAAQLSTEQKEKEKSQDATNTGDDQHNNHKRPRTTTTDDDTPRQPQKQKGKPWPATLSDDWTPPGTTIVSTNSKGSIHTCSDKICRWNYLGLQGSLLMSVLEEPLYISTLTVGRKLTECICRRAVCCRMEGGKQRQPSDAAANGYRMNHPAILGTAVYMDESGVVETNADTVGQDVRFHSPLSWAWWSSTSETDEDSSSTLECIDGSTGLLVDTSKSDKAEAIASRVSTQALVGLFLEAYNEVQDNGNTKKVSNLPTSLTGLRLLKEGLSTDHENTKELLLTKHRILRQWKRRSTKII